MTVPTSVIIKPAPVAGPAQHDFVLNEVDLKKAFKIAKHFVMVIVEEQLEGPVYRATIINGTLAGVLAATRFCNGDGIHSIAELIDIKNSQPHPELKTLLPMHLRSIFVQTNLKLSSVLEKVRTVNLTEKSG